MGTGAKCVKGKTASERNILKALLAAVLAKELFKSLEYCWSEVHHSSEAVDDLLLLWNVI